MTNRTNSTLAKIADFKRSSLCLALGLIGFLLSGQHALAGTWYASSIIGPEPLTPWATMPAGGSGVTLFATGNTTGTIYMVRYISGAWHFDPVYSSASAPALWLSVAYFSPTDPSMKIYIAHGDLEGMIRLTTYSSSTNWQWTTKFVDSGTALTTVLNGGQLYIFYTHWNQASFTWVLRCAIYDGSNFYYETIDGAAGTAGGVVADMACPAAVAAPDGLRLYYIDEEHGTLREAYSLDGSHWTSFHALDGPSGPGQGNMFAPAAIVFNGTVNVFYVNTRDYFLRLAQLRFPGGWSFGDIDNGTDPNTPAPVIHGGAMQVYYTFNGQLQGAWGTGPGKFQVAPLDGDWQSGLWAVGGSPHWMTGPVAAAEANYTAPSVFYLDSNTGALRNSYWQP